MRYEEVVFLQPGFLGFERFKNFAYFDQRVVATLRSHLEASRGYTVPVIALPTCPSATLATRQKLLLEVLNKFDENPALRANKYHIIGHSTGGVDATLLLNDAPLIPTIKCDECADSARFGSNSDWNNSNFGSEASELDSRDVRSKIGTVIPLSAPQWGTHLTKHPITRWFRHPWPTFENLKLLGEWLPAVSQTILVDDFAKQGLINSLLDGGASLMWLVQTIGERELVDCLQPEQMTAVQQQANFGDRVSKIKTVVSAVAASSAESKADKFFNKLYAACAQDAPAEIPSQFTKATTLLDERMADPNSRIGNPSAIARDSDIKLNDAIVTSAYQLLNQQTPEQELLAVVLGDHLDVLGHYPITMREFYTEKLNTKVEERGIIKSGSGFGDSEFLQLWRTIAGAL